MKVNLTRTTPVTHASIPVAWICPHCMRMLGISGQYWQLIRLARLMFGGMEKL